MHSSTDNTNQVDHLQRAFELEAGRSEVLRRVAKGDSIESVLKLLCEKAEIYNSEMKSSVLLLDNHSATLHPIASVSLPEEYCQALDGVKIGMGVGSCGTAAFSKKRVVAADIGTDPNWTQYKNLALDAGLHACWSEPIMGFDDKVYGTFAMYYSCPTTPTQEDLAYIETCANLAAIVFENHKTRQSLVDANKKLSQTVDQRNEQLTLANKQLSEVLEQQKETSQRNINIEKANTTNMLLMGVAHEMNTPLGVAITSNSSSLRLTHSLSKDLEKGVLTKSAAIKSIQTLYEGIELTSKNLCRAASLLDRFSEMDTKHASDQHYVFDVKKFIQRFNVDVKCKYPMVKLEAEVEGKLSYYSPNSLYQLLSHLVENSVIHGFDNDKGNIFVSFVQNADDLHITYHDDGNGISQQQKNKIFQPFFSTQRRSGKIGLGLSIVSNIINNTYAGTLELVDSPVGVRYKIVIPYQRKSIVHPL